MPKFVDLTGQKFNSWLIIGRAENNGARVMWHVRCDCGHETTYRADTLREGRSKMCRACTRTSKHGRDQMYDAWRSMHRRCGDNGHVSYADYGGRGIYVCERWQSFDLFFEDMGERPSSAHTLERMDNDGPYSPENCKWATQKEQHNNKRSNRLVTYQGIEMTVTQLAERVGIDRHVIYQRLKYGYTVDEAVTKPVNRGTRLK